MALSGHGGHNRPLAADAQAVTCQGRCSDCLHARKWASDFCNAEALTDSCLAGWQLTGDPGFGLIVQFQNVLPKTCRAPHEAAEHVNCVLCCKVLTGMPQILGTAGCSQWGSGACQKTLDSTVQALQHSERTGELSRQMLLMEQPLAQDGQPHRWRRRSEV